MFSCIVIHLKTYKLVVIAEHPQLFICNVIVKVTAKFIYIDGKIQQEICDMKFHVKYCNMGLSAVDWRFITPIESIYVPGQTICNIVASENSLGCNIKT